MPKPVLSSLSLKSFLRSLQHALKRCTTAASFMEYATVLGLVALVSVAAVGGSGKTVSQTLCLAADQVRGRLTKAEPLCPPQDAVAEGSAPDAGGGQGTDPEPPLEENFAFDTTGLFFPNVILPEGTTTTQTLLTNFAGVYSTDVEYQIRRLESSTPLDRPTTTGVVVNSAGTTVPTSAAKDSDIWSKWTRISPSDNVQIGLQMTPPESTFAPLTAYYEVGLRPVDRPSLTETFAFSVTRAGGQLVFAPDLTVADLVLPMETIREQDIMFDLKGAFNTDLTYQIRRNGALHATDITHQMIRDTARKLRYGDTNMGQLDGNGDSPTSRIDPAQTAQLGLKMWPSRNVFKDVSAQYDLLLSSVEAPDDVRTYTFMVTRPGKPFVFEPHLAVADVVWDNHAGGQRIMFDLTGTIDTDLLVSVRRTDATNMGPDTNFYAINEQKNIIQVGTTTEDNPMPAAALANSQADQLGISVDLPYDRFLEATATYEISIASAEAPDNAYTFPFSITRKARAVIFEPQIAVAHTEFPVGTTYRQDVWFELSGDFNTDLLYSVRRTDATNMEPVTTAGYINQDNRVGAIGSTTSDAPDELIPATKLSPSSIKKVGVRVTPISDTFAEATATYEINLASVQTPEDVRTFTFTVARPGKTLVFDANIAAQDIVLPVGTTSEQQITFDLTHAVPTNATNILFDIRRVSATNMGSKTSPLYMRADDARIKLAEVTDDALSPQATLATSTKQLGVALTPTADRFVDAAATYEIRVAPEQNPTLVKTYTFTVSRVAEVLQFAPAFAPQDTTFAMGTTGAKDILFDIGGTFNTNVKVTIGRTAATNMGSTTSLRTQTTTGTMTTPVGFSGNTQASTTITPATTSKVGFQVSLDSDPFKEVTAQYTISLTSVEDPEDVRTYTISVSRPAQPVVFEPQLAVENITAPVGSNGTTVPVFDLSGDMNTSVTLTVRRTQATNMGQNTTLRLVATNGVNTNVTTTSGTTISSTHTFTPTNVAKIGVQIDPVSDTFVEAKATYEFTLASVKSPQNTRTFTFTYTRPAKQMVFNPQIAVQSVSVPAGTVYPEVLFDLGGEVNTGMLYSFRRITGTNMQATTVGIQQSNAGVVSNVYRSSASGTNASPWANVSPSSTAKLGVRLYMSNNVFEESSTTYELQVASDRTPNNIRTFTFTAHRPADTIIFEPNLAMQDVVLAPGSTGYQDIVFPLSGTSNTPINYALRRIDAVNMDSANTTYTRRQHSNGTIYAGASFTGNTTSSNTSVTIPTYSGVVARVAPSSDTTSEARATYEIILSSAQDPSLRRTFTFTYTRPAQAQ